MSANETSTETPNATAQELELKLVIDPAQRDNALAVCRDIAAKFQKQADYQKLNLENAYYDTSDLRLRQFDMGLRIRRSADQLEQTIKLAGRVLGGMHERPEYNVPTVEMAPDLTLFDADIWPDDFPVYDVQRDLQQLFVTDFTRHRFLLPSGDGYIECVLDLGQIEANGETEPLAEIELELQGGEITDVYKLGQQLVQQLNATVPYELQAGMGISPDAKGNTTGTIAAYNVMGSGVPVENYCTGHCFDGGSSVQENAFVPANMQLRSDNRF